MQNKTIEQLREEAKQAKIGLCLDLIDSNHKWGSMYSELELKYNKLLKFVHLIASAELMNHTQDEPATDLLKEIGEQE